MSKAKTVKEGIHIIAAEIRNMYRIRFARVQWLPEVGFVKVTGDNGDGKTALLRAIKAAFGGAGEVISEAVLNDDANGQPGYVKLELSNDFTVKRTVTEENPKGVLHVVSADGGKYNQGTLNGWMGGHHDFDVLAFFGLKPPRQTEILLGLGKDPDLAKKLGALRQEHDTLFAKRTPFIAEQRRARAVKRPEGERPEAVDVSAAMATLDELTAAQVARDALGRKIDGFRERLHSIKDARATAVKENFAIAATSSEEIRDLQLRLAKATERAEQHAACADRAVATLDIQAESTLAEGKQAKAEYEALPDPSPEIQAVKARLSAADEVNGELAPWARWEAAGAEEAAATKAVAKFDAKMAALKKKETALIANAGIPVDGLSFDEAGEPLLNGKTLSVASGAERIRMSVAVAMAADPELRVCLVDEANDLGIKAMQALDEEAKRHNFQIIGCRLGLEGPGEIVVDDGQAWARGDEKDWDKDDADVVHGPDFDEEENAGTPEQPDLDF